MPVNDPLNRRERRHVRDNDPVMSNRDWGIDLPEKLRVLVEEINNALEEVGDINAYEVKYDDAVTVLGVDNVQDAIEALYALIASAANEERHVRANFTFATPSPLVIGTQLATEMAVRTIVVITTPFDGVGAALTVGTPSDAGLIFGTGDLKPEQAAQYESTEVIDAPAVATPVRLSITPSGSTVGAGFVLQTFRKV